MSARTLNAFRVIPVRSIVFSSISPARLFFAFGRGPVAATTLFCLVCTTFAQEAVQPRNNESSQQAPLPLTDMTAPQNSVSSPPASPGLAATPARSVPTQEVVTDRAVAETPRRFKYTFGVTARGVYDDNIFNSSSNPVSAYYFTIEPFISLGLGDPADGFNFLNFIYRPSAFFFVDYSSNDSVQQIIHLDAQRRFSRLTLSLLEDIQLLDGTDLNNLNDPSGNQANTDISGRNRHQIYDTRLSGSYELTGKTFLSGGGRFSANEYPSAISSQILSGNFFINYNYSKKLVLGVGPTVGYNTNGPSINDQTFEQASVRLTYSATAKINVSASVGVEFRQFASNVASNTSPVYELDASYRPFDGTLLSLRGSRDTINSASLAGQSYFDTTINFSLTQRLMQRFFFGFAIGYTNTNYFSTVSGVSATRNDNFYYIVPSVDFNVTRFWTFGAYYVHREDSSSVSFFSFTDNQLGLRTQLTF